MNNFKRPQGMSQLDYLWLNFGGYTIGTEASSAPKENAILTELAVTKLIQKATGGGIISLEYRDHPDNPDLVQLIGTNVEGTQLAIVDMPKEVHVESFVNRKVTQSDIDNGCPYDLNSNVLSIKLTNGKEYLVDLETLIVRGAETDTISTNVTNGIINSHVRIDKASNELSVVELRKSTQGLYPYLKISEEASGVELVKTNSGLKARIPIGDNEVKFSQLTYDEYCLIEAKDPTTVYFISDKPYLYLGTQRYGIDIQAGMSIVSSLTYDSKTMTLTYTTTDADQPVSLSLGPASNTENGMMSKESYIELQQLGKALNGITSVEDYVKEQTANFGTKIERGQVQEGKYPIYLKSQDGNILSTVLVEQENFLKSVTRKKATPTDVEKAAAAGLNISVGDNIIAYNMLNGDTYYLDVAGIVINYAFSSSNSILFSNNNGNVSADLNLNDNKIIYIDENGVNAGIQLVRDENYIYIYGKTKTTEDLIGKFKSPRRNLETAHFFPSISVDTINTYQPHYLDWEVYNPDINPVVPGEDYYVLVYEDLVTEEYKNYYLSIGSIASGIKISTLEGNLLRYDSEGALYASLDWNDVE